MLLNEQDTKRQRLARKAELARLSRRRKKSKLCDLESENAKLRAELERERQQRKLAQEQMLKVQQEASAARTVAPVERDTNNNSNNANNNSTANNNTTNNNTTNNNNSNNSNVNSNNNSNVTNSPLPEQVIDEEIKFLTGLVRRLVQSPNAAASSSTSPDAVPELEQVLKNLLNVLKKRTHIALNQVESVQKYLAPALPLRFLEWVMSQTDKFYEDNSGLWSSLVNHELNLSTEQLSRLAQLRPVMHAQKISSAELKSDVNKLQDMLVKHVKQSTENWEAIMSVFQPEQLGKLLNWIDSYGKVCVQINLWRKNW